MSPSRSLLFSAPRVRDFAVLACGALLASSCLKLEPSPLQQIGPFLGGDCHVFLAYGNANGYLYSYSDCDPVVRLKQAVLSGTGMPITLARVAKTSSGFIGLSSTSKTIYTSTDGVQWSAGGTYGGDAGSGVVAACGNGVVIASYGVSGPNYADGSTSGGPPFSPLASFGTLAPGGLRDLICDNGVFHLSGLLNNSYYYARPPANVGTWTFPSTGPTGAPLGLAANGGAIMGYFAVLMTYTYYSLAASADGGQIWATVPASQIGNGASQVDYAGAIVYAAGRFYSPYRTTTACIMRRFVVPTAIDDSVHSPVCSTTATRFTRIEATGSMLMAVGTLDGSTTPLLILSTDGGATWTAPGLPAASGVTGITELVAF